MGTEENNEMERLYAETFHSIEPGALISGTVLAVKQDGIIVDIGYKSEGFIRIDEFGADELRDLRPGSRLEVYVVSVRDMEGVVYLSKERAAKIKTWDALEKVFQEGANVEGKILEKTKGGLTVDIGGVKAFLPASQIDTRIVKDLDGLIGRTERFRILRLNNRRSNIIVSRRAIIEEERAHLKTETLTRLREGAVMKGTVKNITDYGVFVDLGGIDGLLHISDISWGRIGHPSERFKVGDVIDVLVLKYEPSTERVTLGSKQLQPDPWNTVAQKYPAGSTVSGRVVSVTDYGVFVEIEDGLEGLVHVSEIEWTSRPKHPSKYLKPGDEVSAVVLKADTSERKLSLSIRKTKRSPWEVVGERYHGGERISGRVRSLTDFGAFVGLPEGVDGLIHISDMSWTRHVRHPSEVLKKGQKVDAVVLHVDARNEKIALGLKQLTPDPWVSDIPDRLRLGDEVAGKVLRLTDFGLFVEMENGVEGLVYSSEIVQPAEGGITEGDEIRARVIKIDLDERKIGLSMKNVKGAAE
ncbi:MAG: 30S ribosomal protein S1 [Thermodesulfovibrionales bacterium]